MTSFDREALVAKMKDKLLLQQKPKKSSGVLVPASLFNALVAEKQQGTEAFRAKQFDLSISAYSAALTLARNTLLPLVQSDTTEETVSRSQKSDFSATELLPLREASDPQIPLTLAAIHANRALAFLHIGNARAAFDDCGIALRFSPNLGEEDDLRSDSANFCKYAYRRAQAAEALSLQGNEKQEVLKLVKTN